MRRQGLSWRWRRLGLKVDQVEAVGTSAEVSTCRDANGRIAHQPRVGWHKDVSLVEYSP